MADRFFQEPSKEMKVIGVTGTNGKTSVSHYIAQLMSLNGMASGVLGTLGYGLVGPDAKEGLHALERTTPNVIDVHRYLAELRDQGAECVAMEVSSHGLDQGRVDQVQFEGAVFTNLTRDHLDYHGTMEAYGAAKRKLFELSGLKFAVLNVADRYSKTMLEAIAPGVEVIGYGLKHEIPTDPAFNNCDMIDAEPQQQDELGLCAEISTADGSFGLSSDLIGHFNLSNLLAAMGVCKALGGDMKALEQAAKVQAVAGRMEMIRLDGMAPVVVDYAHTPDALANLLEAVRPYCKGRLHVMFGCGGDRDTGKRAEMARIAEQLADHVVVTDDNPRTEDPQHIVQDILKGFASEQAVDVIHGREKAIAALMQQAAAEDIVVLAGKGHEQYQEINDQKIAFSDLEVARKAMGKAPGAQEPGEEQGATCD